MTRHDPGSAGRRSSHAAGSADSLRPTPSDAVANVRANSAHRDADQVVVRSLRKDLPMAVTLAKGGNVSLSKAAPNLTTISVGLGWDARSTTGASFDLDASALATGQDRKVLSDLHFVFYNNLRPPTVRSSTPVTTLPARETATTNRSTSTSLPFPRASQTSSSPSPSTTPTPGANPSDRSPTPSSASSTAPPV